MKIIKLTFENINSLKGKWQINFEDAAFDGNALFAITGATGAGKTTVLDAICLALYGETPRITVSPAHNELMSIGTAFASSEVIFRVNQSIYRAHWSQRRANKNPDGKLQPVIRELSLLNNNEDIEGKIIEEKANNVNKKVVEILGMNKEQFTRSVMLVQGEFSAFLQAEVNERGAILEQITGTQIYAEIGKLAFEKNKEQAIRLKELSARLDEVNCMDKDAFDALLNELEHAQLTSDKLNKQLHDHEVALNIFNQYQKLNDDIKVWQTALTESENQLSAFADDRERLRSSKLALEIAPFYQQYQTVCQEYNTANQSLVQLNNQLPTLKVHAQTNEAQLVVDRLDYEKAVQAYQDKKPAIADARKLDQAIALTEQSIHQATEHYQQKSQGFASTAKDISKTKSELQAINDQLNDIHQSLSTNEQDENLLDKINTIKQSVSKLDDAKTYITKQAEHLYRAHRDLQQASANRQAKLDEHQSVKQQFDQAQSSLNELQYRLATLFGIATDVEHNYQEHLTNFDNNLKQLQQKIHHYEQLISLANTYQSMIDDDKAYQQSIRAEQQNLHNAQQALVTKQDSLQSAMTLQSALNEVYETKKQLIHMRAHFDELTDGKPCPLCGSTSHPYKTNSAHLSDDDAKSAKEQLDAQIAITSELQAQVHQDLLSIHALETKIANLLDVSQQNGDKHRQIHRQMMDIWVQYQSDESLPTIDSLQDNYQTLLHKYNQDDAIKQQVAVLIYELNDAGSQVSRLELQLQHIKSDGNAIKVQISQLLVQIIQLQSDIRARRAMMDAQCATLNQNYSLARHSYDDWRKQLDGLCLLDSQITFDDWKNMASISLPTISHLGIDGYLSQLNQALQTLHHQYEHYQTLTQQKTSLTHEQIELKTRLNALMAEHKSLETDCQALQKQQNDYQQILHNQQAQRQALLGSQSVDEVEYELQSAISHHQVQLNQSGQIYQASKLELEQILLAITHHTDQATHLLKKQQSAQLIWQDKLVRSSFVDEVEFLAAQLDMETVQTLEQTLQTLESAHQLAKITYQDRMNSLNQLQQNHPDVEQIDAEMLQETVKHLKEEQALLHQKIGELSTKKSQEIGNRHHQQQLIEQINQQKAQNEIWAKLDVLIGSADGRKYRNFVQGLTLDMVLHHANHILQKMNDRYLLTQNTDSVKALEILVTDLHQGDVVRSSKNLSGGETFMVSLALALGLSQMNSRQMQIESLFLDEGFGTLDENALDMALNTLFELQQSGKSIGIISHVASLKERIDTQIIIEKGAGGTSTMSGAGVTRLE